MKNLYICATLIFSASAVMAQSGGGGTEDYLLEGNNSFNLGLNECESDDPAFPHLRFTISGVQSGILISDGSGEYALPLAAGVHILTPELENPEYFDVAPSQVTVSFPDDTTPALRNFCVNPVGVNPDLEVVVVPMGDALPGSAATYRIIYRNKGNQLMTGSVALSYNAQAMALLSSDTPISDQSPGYLSFDFEELNPFRANAISVTFAINPDSGDPPVSPGDVLAFTASVTSVQEDVDPSDNSYLLNDPVSESALSLQMVCVEGENVGTSTIGEFVHYLIRFENTTDIPIQDLVVSSELNPDELDISSVVIIKGSHDFHSRITGNTLMFYLDDIGLPGIGLENKGYILYRVRTAQTLVAGSTFSNSAMISFDQSPAIPTNTFTTTIQSLSMPGQSPVESLAVWPNPGQTLVRISFGQTSQLEGVGFYNLMGQRVGYFADVTSGQTLDVSGLASGIYMVRLQGGSDRQVVRFVKN